MTILGCLRLIAAAFILFFSVASPLRAQDIDPARMVAARDLLDAAKIEQDVSSTLPAMFEQMSKVMTPFFLTDLPEGTERAAFIERTNAIIAATSREFLGRTSELLDGVARLYAEAFSVEEMAGLAAFHRSPVGTKLREVEVALQTQLVQLISDIALGKPLEKPEGIDPSALAGAREMFAASRFDETLDALFASSIPKGDRGKNLIAALKSRRPEMTETAAAFYAKSFSAQELGEVTAFYRSPHGAKLVDEQARLLRETARATDDFSKKFADQLSQKIADELKKAER
jgi:hypothetical protein